jgi:type III pantothenate kinase
MTCVNAPSGQRVESHLAAHLPQVHLAKLTCADVPLKIEVDFPQLVGIDRLMAAVGACALRDGKRPLIVICAGTAITVNLVSAAGAFQGGAILPGMAMASQILQRYTDKLPWIDTQYLHGPSPVGKNTEAALASGIYWGTVGALRSLIDKMSAALDGDPQIFITGGDAPQIASQLPAVEHVEDLVLSGIALTVRSHRQSAPGQGAT